MVVCEHCGSNDVQWRCTNNQTNKVKYKCLECNDVFLVDNTKSSVLDNKDVVTLQIEMGSLLKQARRDGGKELAKRNMRKRPSEERYLYKKKRNRRAIYKRMGNKTKYFGTYTKKDACKIRDELIKCDWDINQLENIKKEVLG